MKKKFKLEDLDCANCAAKMEAVINKIEGVEKTTVGFMIQHLAIRVDESRFDDIMNQAVVACKKVEPDRTVLI